MLENLKIFGINIKEYLFDIILLAIVGILTNYIFYLIEAPLHNSLPLGLPNNYDIFPLTSAFLKIAVWIIAFLLIRSIFNTRIKDWLSTFYPYNYEFDMGKNKLDDERFCKEWIFQGNTQPLNGGLLVSNSNSGCLIKSRVNFGRPIIKGAWKHFTANIDLEFPPQTKPINPPGPHNPKIKTGAQYAFEDYLGIIFRAQSFDDYLMLEITRIDDNLVIRPHLRIGGNWDAPILNVDVNSLPLTSQNIALNIVVREKVVLVSLGKNTIKWLLPTNAETNLIQHSSNNTESNGLIKINESRPKYLIADAYFRNRAGMFGFRCYGNQVAFVKSLSISSN